MDYITITEAGSILKVTDRTVYRYIDEGLLTLHRIVKKPVLSRDEVEELSKPKKVG